MTPDAEQPWQAPGATDRPEWSGYSGVGEGGREIGRETERLEMTHSHTQTQAHTRARIKYSQCTHETRGDISVEPESERPEDRCKED